MPEMMVNKEDYKMKKTIALLLSLLIALSCTAAAFADDAAAEDPEA